MEHFEPFLPPLKNPSEVRKLLGHFDRAKVLEIYFSRLDGRTPERIPAELADLYATDLNDIKEFLLGQKPTDLLLQQILNSKF